MKNFFTFLIPWEPSLPIIIITIIIAYLFIQGTNSKKYYIKMYRKVTFWSGLILFYLLLHTKIDYYAEHQFFVHRLQHLALHHIAPFLIMIAHPTEILRRGLPLSWRILTRKIGNTTLWKNITSVTMNPLIISIIFIINVLLWIVPEIQFISMIDWKIYHIMNWSVSISGLLYWNIILDYRSSPPARCSPGGRVISPLITMIPQILAGAIITFTNKDLYPIFELCGRNFFIQSSFDQNLGGLIIWIPASGIEALGTLIALNNMIKISKKDRKLHTT